MFKTEPLREKTLWVIARATIANRAILATTAAETKVTVTTATTKVPTIM